jgi:hypothetical protein
MSVFSKVILAGCVAGLASLPSEALAQLSPHGESTQFVSYSFPGGMRMEYDQRYKVGITMRNDGPYAFDTAWFSIVQDETDINWRPNFSTPMFSKAVVQPNETFDINFYVTPKVSGWCHLGDCQYTFRWQLMTRRPPLLNATRFGAITPVAGLRVSHSVQPPTTPPPNYSGMVYTPPAGATAPNFTPPRADDFPEYESNSPGSTPPPRPGNPTPPQIEQ